MTLMTTPPASAGLSGSATLAAGGCQVQVDHGAGQRVVPEIFLDVADGNARLDQVCSVAVTVMPSSA